MAYKNPLDQAQNLLKTQKFASTTSPQLKHKKGEKDPSIPGDNASYFWHRQYKSPRDLVDQIRKENEAIAKRRETISPLDEFKLYEQTIYSGADANNESDYFGIPFGGEGSKYNIAYPKLLEAYGKSKGKYARSIDPEVQKYFNEQLARRQNIQDRVNKVPEDKWHDFAYGYGPFSDPFDWEGDESDALGRQEFLDSFDYSANDWDTLERYLEREGY